MMNHLRWGPVHLLYVLHIVLCCVLFYSFILYDNYIILIYDTTRKTIYFRQWFKCDILSDLNEHFHQSQSKIHLSYYFLIIKSLRRLGSLAFAVFVEQPGGFFSLSIFSVSVNSFHYVCIIGMVPFQMYTTGCARETYHLFCAGDHLKDF